jgi:hypothetical protein
MPGVNKHGFDHIYAIPVGDDLHIWNIARLWELARALTPESVETESLHGVDENLWFTHTEPTLREVVVHAKKIANADMSYPIILDVDGSIMDGAHRIAKAMLEGRSHVRAVRFSVRPAPDVVDVGVLAGAAASSTVL